MTATAVGQARQALTALMRLATISDRLGLAPVAVSLRVATYGGRSVAVQFAQDDRASVDALATEIGADPNNSRSPTLYDRKLAADGIEWGTYCGITPTNDDDTPGGVTE